MAEGMLGGILGEEDERPEVESPDARGCAEAFASAVAAKLAGSDPQVALDTSAFLKEQTQLLKAQREHLGHEQAARLHFLQGQAREVDIRRFGLRLRVGFQLFLALLATVLGVAFAVMVHDAVTSRSVVIDSFDIAPNIAAEVPNGKIVAAGLLDVLTLIQSATRSNAEHRALSNAWTGDIGLEVPETGISIGQIERMLKTRFGHDQHIEGDLTRGEKGGLALTVRGNGILPKTFNSDGNQLDGLLRQAGEYVYGQSQPGLWTAYLSNNNRYDDAISFAQRTYATVIPSERPFVLNYWGNAITGKAEDGAMREALPLYQETVRLKPDFWNGYNNIMYALSGLGDEEGLVRMGEQMIKIAGGRPGRAPENMYQNYDQAVWDLPALRANALEDVESYSGIGTTAAYDGAERLAVAQYEAQMYDIESAQLRLKTTLVEEGNAPDVNAAALARALVAENSGDLKSAAMEWDVFAKTYAIPNIALGYPSSICQSAVTYEKTGQPAKADAALKPFSNGAFVDCYRFQGDVLDLRGDWNSAQEWYAKAVKLGPSLPAGYYSWGLALAKHGDLEGASSKFKDANSRGPHWADPLKAWGDVLMGQGRAKDALVKYEEALKYAPKWKELLAARDAAAKARA